MHLIDLVRWNFGDWRRVAAHAGIAYPSRSAPGVSRPPDAEDYCTVLGELDDMTGRNNGHFARFTWEG